MTKGRSRVVAAALLLTGCVVSTTAADRQADRPRAERTDVTTSQSRRLSPNTSDVTPPPTPTVERPSRPVRHVFPIRPARRARYGRSHHDYPATDIFAPCGSAVVSPIDGTIDGLSRFDEWSPDADTGVTRGGRYVSIFGRDGVRYYGSHLRSVRSDLRRGTPVRAGERIGQVGRSGNARSTPCHLHFGISPRTGRDDWRVRRGVIWPWPYLDAWRAGRSRSPREAIARWARRNG